MFAGRGVEFWGLWRFFGDKYPESNVRVVTIPDPRSPRGFFRKNYAAGRM